MFGPFRKTHKKADKPDLYARIGHLERENRALWDRMVDLEKERQAHDGTMDCPGCASEAQRLFDDISIDDIVPGGDLRNFVREVIIEELTRED